MYSAFFKTKLSLSKKLVLLIQKKSDSFKLETSQIEPCHVLNLLEFVGQQGKMNAVLLWFGSQENVAE